MLTVFIRRLPKLVCPFYISDGNAFTIKHTLLLKTSGWSGGAMVQDQLPRLGVLLIWMIVGQGLLRL